MSTINREIIIKNITPIYDKTEDRIRLSINYKDVNNRIDLMLTRSFLFKMLPAIEEYSYKHYPNEMIEDEVQVNNSYRYTSKNTYANSPKDITKSKNVSKTQIDDLNLYKKDEDLLFSIKMNFDKNAKHTILTFISKNNVKAIMRCDYILLNNVVESIKRAIPRIEWGIGAIF